MFVFVIKNLIYKFGKMKIKMKKILIVLFISVFISSSAQEYKYEDKTISAEFEINGKSKTELYSLINKWIITNYNSAKTVTVFNDSEKGNIIVKGINEIKYKNTWGVLFPKRKYPELCYLEFNYLIEINVYDNKYKIVYKIVDIATTEDVFWRGINSLRLKSIGFISVNDAAINEYNNFFNKTFPRILVRKERRNNYLSYNKPMFQEISNNLIIDIKSKMESVSKSILVDNYKF